MYNKNDLLVLEDIEKSFASNRVLRGVNMSIVSGKITILMGANGAGKSTLVKLICGVYTSDSGVMRLAGDEFSPQNTATAIKAGVVTVHQNINDGVVPDLNVASNLLLDELPKKESPLFLNKLSLYAEAQKVADNLGLDIDVTLPVKDLSLANRQLISIARAMSKKPKLLILDEPTSSLSSAEANRLFDLLDDLKNRGVAILYISHRMSDIVRLADRIISMRDGEIKGIFEGENLHYEKAVEAMLGRAISDVKFTIPTQGETVMEFNSIQLKDHSKPFSFSVCKNEIVAVVGLIGVGKSKLADSIFAQDTIHSGTFVLNGEPYHPIHIKNAINKGVFMCSKDRGNNGVIGLFDVKQNISLPFLSVLSKYGFINRKQESEQANYAIKDLGIVCQSHQDNITTLSGGNQQKVMVSRWLSHPSKLLLLDEPFQGVDISARRDIAEKLRATAKERATIIFAAELDEALEIADRILVMYDFTVVGEHRNENVDIDTVVKQISGQAH